MRNRTICLLAPFALACVLPSCGNAVTNPGGSEQMSEADLQQRANAIAAQIGLALPAAARVEHAEAIEGRDDAARIVLVMSENAWQGMLRETPFGTIDPATFDHESVFFLGPDEGAWQPRADATIRVAQMKWRETEAMNVGIGDADGGDIRLYLFWHRL